MLRLILLINLLLFASCLTEKKRQQICSSCPVIIKDSIREVTKTTSFDTTLFLSTLGKDIMFDFSGDCCSTMDSLFAQMGRSNGTITATENGIKSSIFKKDKNIVFRCEADSLRAVVKAMRTIIETLKSKVETKVLPAPPCEKPHEKWYDKYARPWFWISWFIILLLLGWKFGPKLLTVFKNRLP